MASLQKIIRNLAYSLGFEIQKLPQDSKKNPHIEIERKVNQFTMTPPRRVYSLCSAVEYICKNKVEGAVVECGVWKGGSMMAIAEVLKLNNEMDRDLYLYDSFEGMPEPSEKDKTVVNGTSAKELSPTSGGWCDSTVSEVKIAMSSTNYPQEKTHFIVGPVEETIPKVCPEKIALLRLDTDWYGSTKHELEYLYPNLVKGGILIMDDYNYWAGQKLAADEFFKEKNIRIFICSVDSACTISVKLE